MPLFIANIFNYVLCTEYTEHKNRRSGRHKFCFAVVDDFCNIVIISNPVDVEYEPLSENTHKEKKNPCAFSWTVKTLQTLFIQ